MSSLPVTLFDKKNGDDLTDINDLATVKISSSNKRRELLIYMLF